MIKLAAFTLSVHNLNRDCKVTPVAVVHSTLSLSATAAMIDIICCEAITNNNIDQMHRNNRAQ